MQRNGSKLIRMEEWVCDDHPTEEMGHDGCNGGGVLKEAQMWVMIIQRRNALQELKECKVFYEDIIYGLCERIEQLEAAANID